MTRKILYRSFFLFLVISLTSSMPSFAATSTPELFLPLEQIHQLEQQRVYFAKADKALDKKQMNLFEQYLSKLDNYPLVDYLLYKKLLKSFQRKKLNKRQLEQRKLDVKQFLSQHHETLYARKLLNRWLKFLAKNAQWQTYIEFYPHIDATGLAIYDTNSSKYYSKFHCYYLSALIHSGQQQLAFSQVKKVWLSPRSQPSSCDSVFEKWEKNQAISKENRWQRIELVMQKNNISLAKYLAKPLPKSEKKILQSWIDIHNKPQLLNVSAVLSLQHPLKQSIIRHGLKRLARKNPKKMEAFLQDQKLLARFKLNKQDYQTAIAQLGRSLATKHQSQAWFWLDKVEDQYSDKYIRTWRVRAAIREQNWQNVLSAIKRLTDEEQQKSRWLYWQAKANSKLGHSELAESIFESLSTSRGYYSFLAADKLNKPYAFENTPLKFETQALNKLHQHPAILRAYEFYSMNRMLDANREWYHATQHLFSEQEKKMAAIIAQSWNWYDRAIITIAHTSERNDIELRFPLLYQNYVKKYSALNQLDNAYTYAVIRRESAFAAHVRSPVGAMGLMQVMPKTGKEIARKLHLPFANKTDLYKPDFNVKIGTHYLKAMLDKHNEQSILASAAYNAGKHRVKAWLPEKNSLEADSWIETIPFTETREYVTAILAYTAIYQYRLSKPIIRLRDKMPMITHNLTPTNNINLTQN